MPTVAREEAVVPVTRREDENEQLGRELARMPAGGVEGTSDGKRKRTEARGNAGLRLPTEVWAEIAAKIDKNDVLAFTLTSKQLREAQQQAGRKLVTRPFWEYFDEDENQVFDTTFFTKDWCAWWSRHFNMTETAPEVMNRVIWVAAHEGYLDVLKTYWSDLPEENKSRLMDQYMCTLAVCGGHLEVLKWLRSEGCPWDDDICSYAAREGHLEVLKWVRSEGCPWDAYTCSQAAEGGHLEVLRWLRSEGCPWDDDICSYAAREGHLEVLKWVRSEGCPWDAYTCSQAAEGGHLEVLKWLRSEGCPWDEWACHHAARGGHLEVLKWLRSEGCPWDENTCVFAAQRGRLEVLKWLTSAGCLWWKDMCRAVGKPNIKRWIDAQQSSSS